VAPRFPGRGRPNVGARIAHLAKRRRTDGTRRTTARGDEHFWHTFLATVRSFLGATDTHVGSILTEIGDDNRLLEADLAKHPSSALDRYLPWLYEQVARGYAERAALREKHAKSALLHGDARAHALLVERHPRYMPVRQSPEDWRELRHWIQATNPDLSNNTLQAAITRAFDWSEHQVAVGGGGPLAENLHERMPEVVLNLGKGWVWRSDGHADVWMAIGRELGHCYKHDFHLKGYINGLMWVLVGPKGKPHVTVTVSDCEIEARGLRNQLPMFRYHKAVWDLFKATDIWNELVECDGDSPQPDLEAITILPPKALLDSAMWQDRRWPWPWGRRRLGLDAQGQSVWIAQTIANDVGDRWRKAREVLADIPGAFPKAFWTYINAVEAFSQWAVSGRDDDDVSAGPRTGHPTSWIVTVRENGERTDYPVDASTQASFVKSIRSLLKSR
jgi:hypothetical protein